MCIYLNVYVYIYIDIYAKATTEQTNRNEYILFVLLEAYMCTPIPTCGRCV